MTIGQDVIDFVGAYDFDPDAIVEKYVQERDAGIYECQVRSLQVTNTLSQSIHVFGQCNTAEYR